MLYIVEFSKYKLYNIYGAHNILDILGNFCFVLEISFCNLYSYFL